MMFIKRYNVTEVFDIIVQLSEWQPTRYQSHCINGIPYPYNQRHVFKVKGQIQTILRQTRSQRGSRKLV